MSEKLFAYGIFKKPSFQEKMLGKTQEGSQDSIKGYKKELVYLRGENQEILVKSRSSNDFIFGEIIEISEEELKKLDEYTKDIYKRIEAVSSNGEDVWIYIK